MYLAKETLGALMGFQAEFKERDSPHSYADVIAVALSVLGRQDVATLESAVAARRSFLDRGFRALQSQNANLRDRKRALERKLARELGTTVEQIQKEYGPDSEHLDYVYKDDDSVGSQEGKDLQEKFIETSLELIHDAAPELLSVLRRQFPDRMFKPWQRL